MKIDLVRKLSPLDRFKYWIRERHQIYRKRQIKQKAPWTDDEILQNYFFTNPYRENDKVTKWFRDNIRNPLKNDPRVLFATVLFRWFNLPETAKRLMGEGSEENLFLDWNEENCLNRLRPLRDKGTKIFTGAYMINSPAGIPKLEAIVDRVDRAKPIVDEIADEGPMSSMEEFHKKLLQIDGMGGFMAYEVVCDLRFTFYLCEAEDIMTWSNPGPGAVRGLYRVLERDFDKTTNSSSPPIPKDWAERTAELLEECNEMLRRLQYPLFEMREVEMSLCETDKYERLLWNEGRSKRRYNGTGN